jgi:hypothetical protein
MGKDLRAKIHRLVDSISDERLAILWPHLQEVACDVWMLSKIEAAQQRLRPGDTLTCEEAKQFLQQPPEKIHW